MAGENDIQPGSGQLFMCMQFTFLQNFLDSRAKIQTEVGIEWRLLCLVNFSKNCVYIFPVLKPLSARTDMPCEKPVGGIKIVLVSLQVFNVLLQTSCTITSVNEALLSNTPAT